MAVATSQNFGIVGNGRQHVFRTTPSGFVETHAFDAADGLYDCCWSEGNENVLLSASGDGSIKAWDVGPGTGNGGNGGNPIAPAAPLRSLHEHAREVQSLSWNCNRRELFLSGSWDDTIKLWTLDAPRSLRTFTGHSYCVYAVAWSPAAPDVFLSASGDCSVRVWDARSPGPPSLSIAAHAHEVLSADWCKYNDAILATGSVDRSIKIWDVRAPRRELATLAGHGYAVRRVAFSPHRETMLASCSYDMTVRLWDWAAPEDAMLRVWDHHTEFAVGLDLSTLVEGDIASTGWDGMTWAWNVAENGLAGGPGANLPGPPGGMH